MNSLRRASEPGLAPEISTTPTSQQEFSFDSPTKVGALASSQGSVASRFSLFRNHQTSDRWRDDHAGGPGEDRVLARHDAERHGEIEQHTDHADDVRYGVRRSYFCVDLMSFHFVFLLVMFYG